MATSSLSQGQYSSMQHEQCRAMYRADDTSAKCCTERICRFVACSTAHEVDRCPRQLQSNQYSLQNRYTACNFVNTEVLLVLQEESVSGGTTGDSREHERVQFAWDQAWHIYVRARRGSWDLARLPPTPSRPGKVGMALGSRCVRTRK